MRFTYQELLNNFVSSCNGVGRAVRHDEYEEEVCCYIPQDHPGCAMGCQPGFREACLASCTEIDDDGIHIRAVKEYFPELFKTIFGETDDQDVNFMVELQNLHDESFNWSGNKIKLNRIKQFCSKNRLSIPESEYA